MEALLQAIVGNGSLPAGMADMVDPNGTGNALPQGSGNPATAYSPYYLLDIFIPGFSVLSTAIHRHFGIDLTMFIPLFMLAGGFSLVWKYVYSHYWGWAQASLMSVCELRPDDELYWQVMAWIATQSFARRSRRFIANSNLTGRFWWYSSHDDDDDDEVDVTTLDVNNPMDNPERRKPLSFTPSFGSHSFWYHGRLLHFTRTQNREAGGFLSANEKEEISISCFGRDPSVLKNLLSEARIEHYKKDERKTFIYRGTSRGGSDVSWQRCMSRDPRPFSTVILNETVKKEVIADMSDYLSPLTRRWYSNRGIPYRRGYLLHGPPGTGKSSLSLALAGCFKMRIYIVSLNSVTASEENLSNLFAELPRRCLVLLEDIDTAGLTHTREDSTNRDTDQQGAEGDAEDESGGAGRSGHKHHRRKVEAANNNTSRLSLSGLLNILDGVASQEGRILVMTTNHLEKLDKALIRPGRVDMMVKFSLADAEVCSAIFRAIYNPAKNDVVTPPATPALPKRPTSFDPLKQKKEEEDGAKAVAEQGEVIAGLAAKFAAKIPAGEFSPADLQGYLLKHKHDPDAALAGVEEWIVKSRQDKQEKETKDAAKKMKEEAKAVRRKEREDRREARSRKKHAKEKLKKRAEKEKKRLKRAEKAKKKIEEEAAKAMNGQEGQDGAEKTPSAEKALDAEKATDAENKTGVKDAEKDEGGAEVDSERKKTKAKKAASSAESDSGTPSSDSSSSSESESESDSDESSTEAGGKDSKDDKSKEQKQKKTMKTRSDETKTEAGKEAAFDTKTAAAKPETASSAETGSEVKPNGLMILESGDGSDIKVNGSAEAATAP